jgi:hypothetical protein
MMSWDTSTKQSRALPSPLGSQVAPWLVEEFVERFVWWGSAAAEVRDAYDQWHAARGPATAVAFAAYHAALDREEQAAEVLQACSERVSGARGDVVRGAAA